MREGGSQELGLALEPPSILIVRLGRAYIGEGVNKLGFWAVRGLFGNVDSR